MKNVFRRLWILCLVSVVMLSSFSVVCFAEADIDLAAFQITYYYNESDGTSSNYAIGVLASVNVNGERVNLVFSPLAPQESEISTAYSTETQKDYRAVGGTQVKGYSLYVYIANPSFGEAEGFRSLGVISERESVWLEGFDAEDGYFGIDTVCVSAGEHPEFELEPKEEYRPVFYVNSKGQPAAYVGKEGSVALTAPEVIDAINTVLGLSASSDTPAPTNPPAPTDPPAPTNPPAQNNTPTQQEMIPNGPIEMPSKEKLFEKAKGIAVDRNKDRNRMILIGTGAAVAVAAAAVVFVILKNKKVKIDNEWIEEAEEGTELADDRTASRLRMSSGQVIWVRQSVTIGRSKENDVVTNPKDIRVSSRHCRVVSQNGMLFVQDLRSTNGTFVDGKRLQPGQSAALSPGTLVGLGVAKGGEAFTVL